MKNKQIVRGQQSEPIKKNNSGGTLNSSVPNPVKKVKEKETQIIAIYGKGGIGKSFTLANLSYMMAQQGKKILLIGCDPKSDTTSLLFGGKACPTIIETSSKKKLAGEEVKIGDVCFKRLALFRSNVFILLGNTCDRCIWICF